MPAKTRRGDRKDFHRHKKLYYTLPSRKLGNIIWLTLGGWVVPLYFLFVGSLYFVSVVGIKKAYLCFRFAQFSLLPFGVGVRVEFEKKKFGNLFWMVTTGWIISLFSLAMSWFFKATIVGRPLGEQYYKLARLTLCPFGTRFYWERPTLKLRRYPWYSKI